MRTLGYVVTAIPDDGSRAYMAIDASSWGYHYWSPSFGNALMLDTEDAAGDQIIARGGDWIQFLHGASNAFAESPVRSVTLAIEKVQTAVVRSSAYSFDLNAEHARG